MSENPLDQIIFISLPEGTRFGMKELDPTQMLPVYIGPTTPEEWDFKDLTWEAIETGLLKILAWDRDRDEVPYYRKLLLSIRPNLPEELLQMGITKNRSSDFSLAEELFLSLEGLCPEESSSYLNLAVFYESYGRHFQKLEREQESKDLFKKAREGFIKALEQVPVPSEAYYMAGLFFFSQGDYSYSRSLLNSFLDHSTEENERKEKAREIIAKMNEILEEQDYYRQAFQCLEEDRNQEGIELIRKFLKSSPRSWNGWFLLGWGLRKEKQWSDALEAFTRALEINDKEPDLLNEMAICVMETGDLDRSQTLLQKALESNKDDIRIISNLAILEMKRENFQKAQDLFLQVLELAPEDPLALGYLEYLDSKSNEI